MTTSLEDIRNLHQPELYTAYTEFPGQHVTYQRCKYCENYTWPCEEKEMWNEIPELGAKPEKDYVVTIFTPGNRLGFFHMKDNPANSSVTEKDNHVQLNVPVTWAIACIKEAGYKVYKEV